jgi:hypothetical protein
MSHIILVLPTLLPLTTNALFPGVDELAGLELRIVSLKRVGDTAAVVVEFRWTADHPKWILESPDTCFSRQRAPTGKQIAKQKPHEVQFDVAFRLKEQASQRFTLQAGLHRECSWLEVRFGPLRCARLVPAEKPR